VSTSNPVEIARGAAIEFATDISLSAPGMDWSLSRSYASDAVNLGGEYPQGNKWLNNPADVYFYPYGTFQIELIYRSDSKRMFNSSGSAYTPPADSYLNLAVDSTNHLFTLTNQANNMRYVFNDLTVANPGHLNEQSTLQLKAQGKSGFTYTYNSDGTINQITSPTGDYNIVFTYNGFNIKKVELQDASSNVLERVEYTYYQDVTSASTDLGNVGDLVQVKVSKKATADTGTTLSIVRYTQYRYGAGSNLKAVYEHDAIQRILASVSGVSAPEDILTKADTYGTPNIHNFASRSFTYYTSNAATSGITTPFQANENLESEYGGSDVNEHVYDGFLKTETIGGCGSCGTANSVTKNYFYMILANSASDQNQVVNLLVEDTQDSAGTAIYRTVYGFEGNGRLLRRAFIQNPTGSPTYWCESWKFATSTGSTTLPYRLGEHRFPSAHTGVTTAANLRNFLNPYNGTSWSNDSGTLNSSAGKIEVLSYNTAGMRTDSWVKNGSSGTAYYVSASDYGDTTNPTLVTGTYDYPTQTTTRSNGKQTSYSYTFYDSSTHQQFKTLTKIGRASCRERV
jgi:hypothetical protein